MSKQLSAAEDEALNWLYGGGDETVECRSVVWVQTRYMHQCFSVMHKGAAAVESGSWMVLERAKVEGIFGSCYTCQACIKAALAVVLVKEPWHQHEFDYNDRESAVVRWCPTCGAVVIDTDYDGRTKPGDVMPMRFAGNA